MKNYYLELPNDYKKDYEIDAKNNKKLIIWFNILSIVICLAIIGVIFLIYTPSVNFKTSTCFILLLAMILYIIAHELVHGIAYKLLTKLKLTFGLTLSVAYCGVPNAYVCKKVALIAILAPFVTFNILFIPLLFVFFNNFSLYLIIAVLLGLHNSGCIGDLYGTYIILKRYKNKDILMNDTGPKQTFYVKGE